MVTIDRKGIEAFLSKVHQIKGGGEIDGPGNRYAPPAKDEIYRQIRRCNTDYGYCSEQDIATSWYLTRKTPPETQKAMQSIFSNKNLSTTEKMDKATEYIKSLPQEEQNNINTDLAQIKEKFPVTQAPSDSVSGKNVEERIVKDCSTKKTEVDLQKIRKLVEANNKSGVPNNMIICQIWHESKFNEGYIYNKNDPNTAKGLMQMQRGSVRGLFEDRMLEKKYQSALLTNPNAKRPKYLSPAEQGEAWSAADKVYNNNDIMLDGAQNISMATEYLKLRIAAYGGNIEQGFIAYGDGTQDYYDKWIKACADALGKAPHSAAAFK